MEGKHLSWCNGHQGLARSWAKLDRVLANNMFVSKFGGVVAWFLNSRTSDHSLILFQLVMKFKRYGPASFRFQNMWTSHDDFLSTVMRPWDENIVAESGLHVLARKLIRLKVALCVWNKEVFGQVDGHIRALEERVKVLDRSNKISLIQWMPNWFLLKQNLILGSKEKR
ncbi:hypothetical protein F2P56_016021 [Juglans regia]|uniref:Uncharacterized protein LOC108989448 n=2 Tax=Juglans regia TaxID=51240 RepID=A0A2I4EGS6_JUGRE|nr:uncharacterized protein LOC108989448 [Juglans regia]KAF5466063.1 hypothetical protein F2P56_016021 [Juglans regia]